MISRTTIIIHPLKSIDVSINQTMRHCLSKAIEDPKQELESWSQLSKIQMSFFGGVDSVFELFTIWMSTFWMPQCNMQGRIQILYLCKRSMQANQELDILHNRNAPVRYARKHFLPRKMHRRQKCKCAKKSPIPSKIGIPKCNMQRKILFLCHKYGGKVKRSNPSTIEMPKCLVCAIGNTFSQEWRHESEDEMSPLLTMCGCLSFISLSQRCLFDWYSWS